MRRRSPDTGAHTQYTWGGGLLEGWASLRQEGALQRSGDTARSTSAKTCLQALPGLFQRR